MRPFARAARRTGDWLRSGAVESARMVRAPASAWTTRRSRAALLALAAALLAGCEADPAVPPGAVPCRADPPRSPGLWVAGSGANLTLARAIAARFAEASPGARVVVPESIGTGGALKALEAGAIDVGLASRPLTAAERSRGLVESELGRVAFAVVVRADLGLAGISTDDLAGAFAGRRPTGWPAGVPLVPVLREPGDSGYVLAATKLPAVGRAFEAARVSGRVPTRYTDQEMRDALLAGDGAFGLLDVATVHLERLPLVPLSLDGVAPTAENVRSGRYPLARQLSLVTRGPPAGEAARFVEFARSAAVSDLFALGQVVRPGDGADGAGERP